MSRLSIKTKLSGVISILVLSFIAFNLLYYPRWVEHQIRAQAELSARQVAETASYALGPAVGAETTGTSPRCSRGSQDIPSFRFSAVYGANRGGPGQHLDHARTGPWGRS